MKKYPAYKKGIYDWWEQVPSTWQEVSMKEVAVLSDERCGERQEELLSVYRELGVIRKNSRNDNHNVESEDLSNYKMVYPGYLVMNKMKMWQGSLGISDYQGIVSPAYIVCKLNGNFDSKYLHTLLRATPFKTYYNRVSRGIRVGQWDMSFSDFRSLKIFLPNLQEQQQIVRYLDWKTSQINHLIHGYERLISLLEERKTAVINEVVTKGIRKGVAMKDSGVEWLGEVPVNWEINRAKWMFSESKERRHDDDEMATASQKYGIILQKDFMEKEQRRIVMADQNTEAWKHVEPNDFVISLRSFQGGLEMSKITGCVTWHYIVLKARKDIYPEYYKWLFKSQGYIHALQRTSDFIRDGQDLRYTNFEKVPLPYLPLDEQKEIAEYITQKLNRIEFVLATTQKEIDLLRERRTRLISDVVTGALDVRDVVVPEYVQEQDMEVTEDGDEYEGERAGETDC